jgi:hypothetical protein
MGEKRNAYMVLVEKPQGMRLLGNSRRRWEGNIKMDFKELELEGVDWIYLALNRDHWRPFVKGSWTFGFHNQLTPWS